MKNLAYLDTLAQVWRSLDDVCGRLAPAEWALPTGCPGWTVQDNLAHISGVERQLEGEPVPTVELPDLARLRDQPMARHIELAVELRRTWTPVTVLDEFRETTHRRLAALRALVGPEGEDPEVTGVMGSPELLSRTLPLRIFDCWDHEQDIRRATGRPGHLEGPAVELAVTIAKRRLCALAMTAGCEPGTVVDVEITAPVPRRLRLVAGDSRDAGEGRTPAAVLRCDMADFTARICGRRDADGGLLGQVSVTGDAGIGERLIAVMGFTP